MPVNAKETIAPTNGSIEEKILWVQEKSEEVANKAQGRFRDADTLLANCIRESDCEFTGISEDVFNIWKNSTDRTSVEAMFYEIAGIEFSDYIELCISTLNEQLT